MKIIELGVFRKLPVEDNYHEVFLSTEFDWTNRQLWLYKIQPLEYREVGNSNYSYDQIGKYNFIFYINAGDCKKSYKVSQEYYYIIQIESYEWYRPEKQIAEELENALEYLPILYSEEVLGAFRYREFYRSYDKYQIEIKDEKSI